MTGIYKIESPTGRVYIGQSFDIKKRWRLYGIPSVVKGQPLISRSIEKYGLSSHRFSVVHELPPDVDKDVLTEYERIYMDAHREAGCEMLNLKGAKGSPYGMKRPEEQVRRHAEFMRGRPSPKRGTVLSEETKEKIRIKRALQVMPKGFKRDKPAWNKGKKMPLGFVKGRPHTDETKEKLRKAGLGKKLSPESIAKRTATLKINGVKRKWSDEAKKKQSERYKGKKKSPETIMKGRETRAKKKEIKLS
jgi:group I intron endonuclease